MIEQYIYTDQTGCDSQSVFCGVFGVSMDPINNKTHISLPQSDIVDSMELERGITNTIYCDGEGLPILKMLGSFLDSTWTGLIFFLTSER